MFAFLDGPELAILIIAVLVLFGGSQIPKLAKRLFFGLVIVGTSVAVYNNWVAIHALGLSPLGSA